MTTAKRFNNPKRTLYAPGAGFYNTTPADSETEAQAIRLHILAERCHRAAHRVSRDGEIHRDDAELYRLALDTFEDTVDSLPLHSLESLDPVNPGPRLQSWDEANQHPCNLADDESRCTAAGLCLCAPDDHLALTCSLFSSRKEANAPDPCYGCTREPACKTADRVNCTNFITPEARQPEPRTTMHAVRLVEETRRAINKAAKRDSDRLVTLADFIAQARTLEADAEPYPSPSNAQIFAAILDSHHMTTTGSAGPAPQVAIHPPQQPCHNQPEAGRLAECQPCPWRTLSGRNCSRRPL
jgi:hypothetical protein